MALTFFQIFLLNSNSCNCFLLADRSLEHILTHSHFPCKLKESIFSLLSGYDIDSQILLDTSMSQERFDSVVRAQPIALLEAGHSGLGISKQFNVSRYFAHKALKKHKETG